MGGSRDQRLTAAALGYGDDVGVMCIEHWTLKTWLGEQLGLSPATPDDETQRVYAFQAYLNGSPPAPILKSLTKGGLRLTRLREQAQSFLRPG